MVTNGPMGDGKPKSCRVAAAVVADGHLQKVRHDSLERPSVDDEDDNELRVQRLEDANESFCWSTWNE